MNQPKQNPPSSVLLMDAEEIRRTLRRIAHEITEGNRQLENVVLAGIPLRGVEIARRIAAFIHDIDLGSVVDEEGHEHAAAEIDCAVQRRLAFVVYRVDVVAQV